LLPNFPVPQFIDALLSVPFSDAVFTFYRFSTSLLFSLLPYLPLRIFPLLKFPIGVFSAFTLVLIFTSFPHFSCPIFALPIFQLPFSVAVFAFHRCCYLSSTSLLYDLLPCLLVPIFLLPKFSFHVFVWLHRCSCFLCRKILLPKFFIDQLSVALFSCLFPLPI